MLFEIIKLIGVFYLGRLSALWVKNRYLEEKRGELDAYREALINAATVLQNKDKEIRKKWQAMVDDISKYEAAINPINSGKWTESDDFYLNSWKSAEK